MPSDSELLRQIARRAMLERGLQPDFPPAAEAQLARLHDAPSAPLQDLRDLPWSSIDNDESRDLDQVEVVIPDGTVDRVLVGIADVAALVPRDTPLDDHARVNTTSVYTPAQIFPMLPPQLSNDRTSLTDGSERDAIVIEIRLDAAGARVGEDVYLARVRNHAKLAYNAVAAWLDGGATPEPLHDRDVAAQVRLQDRIAAALRATREAEGALDFDRAELTPVLRDDHVVDLRTDQSNRARDIIETFMVAANGVTARFLTRRGFPAIRRVVKAPARWPRIVSLAATHGATLPSEPDAAALAAFLRTQHASSPATFGELSLAILKLLGRGEYVAAAPDAPSEHFALAITSYTHSTAPNRRYPDLVTQRQIRAALAGAAPAYDLAALTPLADHCTAREDDVNKVERLVKKAAAALWLRSRIGSEFDGVVTGASPKGTWVRIAHPVVEGRLERGAEGLDVGDRVRVRLVSTNPERGFIDFERG